MPLLFFVFINVFTFAYTKDMDKTERKIFISFASVLGVVLVMVIGTLAYFWLKYPLNYGDSIRLYANRFDLEPELVASVINVESGFDKKAISDKGAVGLMQLMPKTALFVSGMLGENLEANSLINSDTNIRLGCKYLMYLGEKFEDEKTVLACYNAGEGVVKRWLSDSRYSDDGKTLKNIPYAQTREYVEKVLHGKEIYKSKL